MKKGPNQQNLPKLNPHAVTLMQGLQSEYGISLDVVEDFPLIRELDRLAQGMTCPGGVENTSLILDLPVSVGKVDLYRPTFAATWWMQSVAGWWPDDDLLQVAATVYAMAKCRDQEALAKVQTPEKARKAVIRWANKQQASMEALVNAVALLLPGPQYGSTEGAEGYGPVMALLLAEIGHTPHFWAFEVSGELQAEIVSDLSRLKWDLHGPPDQDNPFEPYERACRQWHEFKKEVIQSCRN